MHQAGATGINQATKPTNNNIFLANPEGKWLLVSPKCIFVCLFINDLLNAAVNNSGYTASNGRVISEY
jgi:hypothetical protein